MDDSLQRCRQTVRVGFDFQSSLITLQQIILENEAEVLRNASF